MENDPNPMPEFKLFTLREIGEKALSLMTFLPSKVLSAHSDHFQRDTGAEAMLDENLDYEG